MISYCSICLNHEGYYNNPKVKEKIRTKSAKIIKGKICEVCKFEQQKKNNKIDWNSRLKTLNKICKWGKRNSNSNYDCIVTVSGGKDGLRQAHIARDELGMNPLLVSLVYPPEQIEERGADNLSNLINLGFDCLSITLDPIKWKELMRHGFLKFGNFFRSTEMALFAAPVHVAIAYQIPLMFYGENPLYTVAHGTKSEGLGGSAQKIQEGNTIKGGPGSLKYQGANKQDFHFYNYPTYEDMKKAKIKIIYLGYYIKDWYGRINGEFALQRGLKKREEKPWSMGDLWGISALDEDFRIVNQHLKYLKRGYGHVTDQVCEAIHQEIMTREEAIRNVENYDGACDFKYIEKLCKYLGITISEFNNIRDKFVNKDLFEFLNGKWLPKFKVGKL
jgi:N-acetyl sugar amidotransferase